MSENKTTKKSKGIRLDQTNISHENYKSIYLNGGEEIVYQTNICSINHQLYTIKRQKVALRINDDKRLWVDKNKSYAYGHWRTLSL